MIHQVRIFDGEGNLLRTVDPVFDANPKQARKFLAHPCPGCGEKTTKKVYCHNCVLERKENPPRQDKGQAERVSLEPPV